MVRTAKKLAVGSAFALLASVTLPGVASAAEADAVTFNAVDNKDCTATFEVVNTTNSGMNEVVYWTGEGAPTEAPAFGKDEGSKRALLATAATKNSADETFLPWFDGNHPDGYKKGLLPVTSTEVVDFSDLATGGEDSVEAVYRMTGLESKDYDTALKQLSVTGCGEIALGSLGSAELFGSLGSVDLFGSLFGNKE